MTEIVIRLVAVVDGNEVGARNITEGSPTYVLTKLEMLREMQPSSCSDSTYIKAAMSEIIMLLKSNLKLYEER